MVQGGWPRRRQAIRWYDNVIDRALVGGRIGVYSRPYVLKIAIDGNKSMVGRTDSP